MASYDVIQAQNKLRELTDRANLGEKITIRSEAGNIIMIGEDEWDELVEFATALAGAGAIGHVGSSLDPTPGQA